MNQDSDRIDVIECSLKKKTLQINLVDVIF